MNDVMMNEGIWPTWLPQALWLEWLQLLLYCLLAIAVVSSVLALLDFAMLSWKEFHPAEAQATTKARTKAAPVSKVKTAPLGSGKSRQLLLHEMPHAYRIEALRLKKDWE
jgi:hypothetical protein